MNIKKIKFFIIITAFLLCFPFHFIYDLFPNTFTSIFFPVNESIWEHMKLPFSSLLLSNVLELGLLYYFHIKVNYHLFNTWISATISIPIYLILYLPLYQIIGESMILNLTILLITISISEYIQYSLNKISIPAWLNYFSIFGIIIIYIIFAYLTYYPPHTYLFYDTVKEKYGLSQYSISKKETNYLIRP